MFKLNVLFANDDVLTQWVMSEVLMEAGFEVTSACRAQQVVELLADEPDFDILIADTTLVDAAAAVDLGHHWQAALPGRPIIYTGPDRLALRRHLRHGEGFLVTPFGAASLLRTIDRALDEARFRPPAPARQFDRHLAN